MNTVIVTGLSGAGKTQAMNCLEDLGYYCVDNMPPALIKSFVQLAAGESTPIEKAAFAVDVRGGELFADMEKALGALLQSSPVEVVATADIFGEAGIPAGGKPHRHPAGPFGRGIVPRAGARDRLCADRNRDGGGRF